MPTIDFKGKQFIYGYHQNGLGGAFTYCTLGEPIDEAGMLTGENLPTYETLADYIAYTYRISDA